MPTPFSAKSSTETLSADTAISPSCASAFCASVFWSAPGCAAGCVSAEAAGAEASVAAMTGDAARPVIARATAGARASFFIFFFRKLQMSVKDCECNDNATCTTRKDVVVIFSEGLGAASCLTPHPRWARRRGGPADARPHLFQRPIGPLDSGQKLVGV